MNRSIDPPPASIRARSRLPIGLACLCGLLMAALALWQPALAQNANGSLSATVTDATGAVVPGAKVVLKKRNNPRRLEQRFEQQRVLSLSGGCARYLHGRGQRTRSPDV